MVAPPADAVEEDVPRSTRGGVAPLGPATRTSDKTTASEGGGDGGERLPVALVTTSAAANNIGGSQAELKVAVRTPCCERRPLCTKSPTCFTRSTVGWARRIEQSARKSPASKSETPSVDEHSTRRWQSRKASRQRRTKAIKHASPQEPSQDVLWDTKGLRRSSSATMAAKKAGFAIAHSTRARFDPPANRQVKAVSTLWTKRRASPSTAQAESRSPLASAFEIKWSGGRLRAYSIVNKRLNTRAARSLPTAATRAGGCGQTNKLRKIGVGYSEPVCAWQVWWGPTGRRRAHVGEQQVQKYLGGVPLTQPHPSG
eukprot:scaffold210025_cov27-Tisochrysis_lutea.AAC.3